MMSLDLSNRKLSMRERQIYGTTLLTTGDDFEQMIIGSHQAATGWHFLATLQITITARINF